MHIWLVDAFTAQAFRGNPATVMILPEFFSDINSLKIASEVNQVETSFVKPLGDDHFHLRWFAPNREVELCGHATLAAAHVLWEEGYVKGDHLVFTTLSGALHVRRSPSGLTLDFPLRAIGERLPEDNIAAILQSTPLSVVRAGDDILVELADADTLRNLSFDVTQLLAFDCRAVIVTCIGDQGYDFISRLFAPRIGVPEDAVSAAAHCKLVDYWHKKTGKTCFKAFQASKRGGEIIVELVDGRVHLTGKAVIVMKGEWLAAN